jgi:hypothetical protein
MKIPGPLGVITVFGNQQTARNIERDFVPGQRNVHCLTTQCEVPAAASPTDKQHDKALNLVGSVAESGWDQDCPPRSGRAQADSHNQRRPYFA